MSSKSKNKGTPEIYKFKPMKPGIINQRYDSYIKLFLFILGSIEVWRKESAISIIDTNQITHDLRWAMIIYKFYEFRF